MTEKLQNERSHFPPCEKNCKPAGRLLLPCGVSPPDPVIFPKKTGGRPYVNARLWIQVFFRYIPA